jgi:hypothetical protein
MMIGVTPRLPLPSCKSIGASNIFRGEEHSGRPVLARDYKATNKSRTWQDAADRTKVYKAREQAPRESLRNWLSTVIMTTGMLINYYD